MQEDKLIDNSQIELRNTLNALENAIKEGDIEKEKKISSFIENQEKKSQELAMQIQQQLKIQKENEEKVSKLESMLIANDYKNSNKDEKTEAKNFYDLLLRKGPNPFCESSLEKKYLRTDSSTQGGVFIPTEYSTEIIKNVTEISPIRQLAKVRNMGSRFSIPTRTSLLSSNWVGEAETISVSNSTYGAELLTAKKLTIAVKMSTEDLVDSDRDIIAEVNEDVVETLSKAEGLAFTKGTGTTQPNGIMSDTRVDTINQAGGALKFDTLIDVSNIKTGYNPVYLMNRNTLTQIKKLKDGNGNYIWYPGIPSAGIPNMLNGFRYFEVPDMDDIGINKYPILFGDIKSGYMIGDTQQMTILRDPLTLGGEGLVRYIFIKRTDGKVVKPEALKKIKIIA